MSLFEKEKKGAGDVEKNRLFETLDKEDEVGKNYFKFLIPIVLVVFVGVAVVVYFGRLRVGDKVRPDDDLYYAVNDNFLTQQKRTPTDLSFYYCGDYYSVEATVEKKDVPPTKPEDTLTEFRATARKGDGGWQVNVAGIGPKDKFTPCQE
jgi:hypothetical protein